MALRDISPWDRNDLVSTRYLHECHEVMMSACLVTMNSAVVLVSPILLLRLKYSFSQFMVTITYVAELVRLTSAKTQARALLANSSSPSQPHHSYPKSVNIVGQINVHASLRKYSEIVTLFEPLII